METIGRACRALSSVAVILVALASCGNDGDEAASLDAKETNASDGPTPEAPGTPGPTPTEEATPEPASEPTPIEHRFPDAGLTVIEPVTTTSAESAALAAYVAFAREWRWSLREVQLSGELAMLAVGPIIDGVEDSLDYQEEHGIRYSGEMVIVPTIEESSERVVVLGGCLDGSALTLTQNGVVRPVDGAEEHPVVPIRVVIANAGAGWMVNENTLHEGQSC